VLTDSVQQADVELLPRPTHWKQLDGDVAVDHILHAAEDSLWSSSLQACVAPSENPEIRDCEGMR
jgi:hypothetical protein